MTRAHWNFMTRNGIYVILFAALLLRVLIVMQSLPFPVIRDEAMYDNFARSLLENPLGYVEIYRPPLYPAFVAFSFLLGGIGRFSVEFLQALLDTVNVALLFALTRTLFRKAGVALIAAGVYAIYPEALALVRQYFTETVFNFFILVTLVLLTRFAPTRARAPLLLAGIALALAALTRELVLYFAVAVVPVWFLLANGLKRATLLQIALFGAGILIVLAPWSVRNYNIERRFVPIATEGEKNVLQDNLKAQAFIECGKKGEQPGAGVVKCIRYGRLTQEMFRDAAPGTRMRVAIAGAWSVISKYPIGWLNTKLEALSLFWKPPTWRLYYFRVKPLERSLRPQFDWMVGTYHVLFLLMVVIGLVTARNDPPKLLICLYLLYVFAIFIVTHFQARYREPLFVVFMPYAAFGVWQCAEFLRRRVSPVSLRTNPRLYAGALLVGLVGILIWRMV